MTQPLEVIPASQNHAIEVMAFAVECSQQFDSSIMETIGACYEGNCALRELLPEREKLKGFIIKADPKNQSVTMGDNGLRFFKKIEDKFTWIAEVRQNIISVSCFNYTRWAEARESALTIVKPILERLLELGVTIQAIGLQYQDGFSVTTADAREASANLFKPNNEWLTEHSLQQKNAWHIHQGWISNQDDTGIILNLLNINAIVDESAGLTSFKIIGQHRLSGASGSQLTVESLSGGWDALHLQNKSVLRSLLNQGIVARIGL